MSVNGSITSHTQADEQLFDAVEAAVADSRDAVAVWAVSYAAKRSSARLKRDARRVQSANTLIDPTGRLTGLLEKKVVEVRRVQGQMADIRQRARWNQWHRIMMAIAAHQIASVAEDTNEVLRIVAEHDSRLAPQQPVGAQFSPTPERLQAITESGARLLREKSVDELAQFSE